MSEELLMHAFEKFRLRERLGQKASFSECLRSALYDPNSIYREDLREALAEHVHNLLSDWMKLLFLSSSQQKGCVIIPSRLVKYYRQRMSTIHKSMSEDEKTWNRVQADKILEIINAG